MATTEFVAAKKEGNDNIKTNRFTITLAAAAVVATFNLNGNAAEALHSPRGRESQIRAVRGVMEDKFDRLNQENQWAKKCRACARACREFVKACTMTVFDSVRAQGRHGCGARKTWARPRPVPLRVGFPMMHVLFGLPTRPGISNFPIDCFSR